MANWPMKDEPRGLTGIFKGFGRPAAAKTAPKPAPKPAPFRMSIDEVFQIVGKGIVVTGTIAAGEIAIGDEVSIESTGGARPTAVLGIERFRKQLKHARAGEMVGLWLQGVSRNDVKPGDILVARA